MAITISLVNTSNTQTVININGTVSGQWGEPYYTMVIEYSPVGSPNSKISHRFDNIRLTAPYIFSDSVSGLKPNTTYNVTALLYRTNKVGGTPLQTKSILCTTQQLTARLETTAKSASIISVMFSEMPRLEFPIRAVLDYKKDWITTSGVWRELETVSVEAGEEVTISHMTTGLNSNTDYLFLVTVEDMTNPNKPVEIGKFYLQEHTLVYTAGADSIVPSFKRYVTVPRIDYVYLQAELNEPLPEGVEVHLYRSQDDTTYTDIGAITRDDLGIIVDANWAISGGIRRSYFKLVIVDANEEEHNESEPLLIRGEGLWWLERYEGDPYDLYANEAVAFSDAILKLYDFDKATGNQDFDPPLLKMAKRSYQNGLRDILQTVSVGAKVMGGTRTVLNTMYALAQVYNNPSANPRPVYPYVLSGDPITADGINTMFEEVMDALNNYEVIR